jgi:hypothetical protein
MEELILPILLIIILISILYGIIIFYKRKKLPDNLIKKITSLTNKYITPHYGPLSIGIYQGTSLFSLGKPLHINNPVLKAEDVTDLDARFIADPFVINKDGRYYMFFEILERSSGLGKIGYAESEDGYNWNYKKVVLDESFHQSYPYVFEYENDIYMVPEGKTDLSVRLYKATNFPTEWRHVGNIIEGDQYFDSSLFRYNNLWWMFTGTGQHDTLNLYYSEKLTDGWIPHPMNPIVKQNPHFARPGGRVLFLDGKIYRLAQDCYPRYGIQLFAFEITQLSTDKYAEKLASEIPVIKGTGRGWNAIGMHHLDLVKNGDNLIVAVDGVEQRPLLFSIYSRLTSRYD